MRSPWCSASGVACGSLRCAGGAGIRPAFARGRLSSRTCPRCCANAGPVSRRTRTRPREARVFMAFPPTRVRRCSRARSCPLEEPWSFATVFPFATAARSAKPTCPTRCPSARRRHAPREGTRMTPIRVTLLAIALTSLGAPALAAREDVEPGTPTFHPGDVITFDEVRKLEPFLPPEFWAHRDFFFYEGMRLEIGPSFADYSPTDAYQQATQKRSGSVKLGPEDSLVGYVAGQPFPYDR